MPRFVSDTEQSLENQIIATLKGEGFITSVGTDGITIMERVGLNFPQIAYLGIAPYGVESKSWTLKAAKPEHNDTVQLLAEVLSNAYGASVECKLSPPEIIAK